MPERRSPAAREPPRGRYPSSVPRPADSPTARRPPRGQRERDGPRQSRSAGRLREVPGEPLDGLRARPLADRAPERLLRARAASARSRGSPRDRRSGGPVRRGFSGHSAPWVLPCRGRPRGVDARAGTAHPVRLPVPGVPDRGVPDALRTGPGERRDAERRPTVHPAPPGGTSSCGDRRGPDPPPHRRLEPGGPRHRPAHRTGLPRAVRGPDPDRGGRPARPRARRPRGRGRHHRRARPRVGDRCGRAPARAGLHAALRRPRDGLLTGFHEAESTHLALLAAFAGLPRLRRAYRTAIDSGYLWHEFGDSHLLWRDGADGRSGGGGGTTSGRGGASA